MNTRGTMWWYLMRAELLDNCILHWEESQIGAARYGVASDGADDW